MPVSLPPGITLPDAYVPDLTTYRHTTFDYELLTIDDAPNGPLLGVTGGKLTFNIAGKIKGGGSISVTDMGQDIDWNVSRIKITTTVNGQTWGLGIWIPTFPAADWSNGFRSWEIDLHDKLVVLDQDCITEALTYPAGTVVTDAVRDVIESAGESAGSLTEGTQTLAAPMMWEAGTSKLTIVNNMLDAAGYFTLRMNANGAYVAEPYVSPSNRPVSWYFEDGVNAIYSGDFSVDEDIFFVPNRVIAIQQGDDTTEGLVSVAENTNPLSPYSFPTVGRWITDVQTGVEATDQDALDTYASRRLTNLSSPTSTIPLQHAPVPLSLYDAVSFKSSTAEIDNRYVIDQYTIQLSELALATSTLRRVVTYD